MMFVLAVSTERLEVSVADGMSTTACFVAFKVKRVRRLILNARKIHKLARAMDTFVRRDIALIVLGQFRGTGWLECVP